MFSQRAMSLALTDSPPAGAALGEIPDESASGTWSPRPRIAPFSRACGRAWLPAARRAASLTVAPFMPAGASTCWSMNCSQVWPVTSSISWPATM
jgi:hypothetical protein